MKPTEINLRWKTLMLNLAWELYEESRWATNSVPERELKSEYRRLMEALKLELDEVLGEVSCTKDP